jgi:hypothetical protein
MPFRFRTIADTRTPQGLASRDDWQRELTMPVPARLTDRESGFRRESGKGHAEAALGATREFTIFSRDVFPRQ